MNVSGRCAGGASFGLTRRHANKARIGDIGKPLFIFICPSLYRQEIGVENPSTISVVRKALGQVRNRIASVATIFIRGIFHFFSYNLSIFLPHTDAAPENGNC